MQLFKMISAAGLTAQLWVPGEVMTAAMPSATAHPSADAAQNGPAPHAAAATQAASPLLFYAFSAGDTVPLADALADFPHPVVFLSGEDWNRELSPWPAPRAFRGGEDFGGEADTLLCRLTEDVCPAVEAALAAALTLAAKTTPCGADSACTVTSKRTSDVLRSSQRPCRVLAGYSLAGLFAVYALYRTDAFCAAVSASGSLWFDGFTDWMQSHTPAPAVRAVDLSLGDREPKARSPRLAAVGEATLHTAELLRAQGAQTAFTWNPGGHFDAPAQRLADGMRRVVALF